MQRALSNASTLTGRIKIVKKKKRKKGRNPGEEYESCALIIFYTRALEVGIGTVVCRFGMGEGSTDGNNTKGTHLTFWRYW